MSQQSESNESITCEYVENNSGEFVSGEMSSEEAHTFQAHVESCPHCTAFLASYRHVIEVAAELKKNDAPMAVDVQNRLRAALNERLGLNLSYIA